MGLRAFARFVGNSGVIIGNAMNIASIVRNAVGQYTITMVANTCATDTYCVLLSSEGAGPNRVGLAYQVTSATIFVMNAVTLMTPTQNPIFSDPTSISFLVVQL